MVLVNSFTHELRPKVKKTYHYFFAAGRKLFVVDIKYECQNELQSKQVQTLS